MKRTLLIVGAVVLAVGTNTLLGQTVTDSVLNAMGNPVSNVQIELWKSGETIPISCVEGRVPVR